MRGGGWGRGWERGHRESRRRRSLRGEAGGPCVSRLGFVHLKRACLERQGKGGGRMETLLCGVLRTPPSDRNTSVARVTATKLASHPSEAAGGESGFGLACCRAGRALTTQKTPAKLEICFPACSSAFIAARHSGSRNRTLSYPRCRSLTCAIEPSPASIKRAPDLSSVWAIYSQSRWKL